MIHRLRMLACTAAACLGIAAAMLAPVSTASACTSPDGCPWLACGQGGGYWFPKSKQCVPGGFNGGHKQVSSNAGACADCRISVATDPRSDAFSVTASNGWKAFMRYRDKGHTTATGTGRWPTNWAKQYAGKMFTLTLTKGENSRLAGYYYSNARFSTEGVPGEIVAKYLRTGTRPTLQQLGVPH